MGGDQLRFELWILFDPLTVDSLQFKSILFKSPLNPSASSPAYIFSLKSMFVNPISVQYVVPGAARKSLHFNYILSCMNTTEMCNTAIEREFCGLFEDDYKNGQKLCYEA